MLTLALFLCAAASLLVGGLAWRLPRGPGSRTFAILMASGAGWSIAYAMEIAAPGSAAKVLWAKLQYPFIGAVPVAWMLFALEYAGQRESRLRRPLVLGLLCLMPITTLALAATNEAHRLVWAVYEPPADPLRPLRYVYGPWFWINAAYCYTLVLIGTVVLVRLAFGSTRAHRRQTAPLVLGAVIPWIANALHLAGRSPLPGIDLTSIAFSLSGFAFGWSLFRHGLFHVVPVARGAVFESMSDGVMVLDVRGHVVDLNPAALRLLGAPGGRWIGAPGAALGSAWEEVLHAPPEEARRFDVSLPGPTARRLEVHASPVRAHDGSVSGRLLLVSDVTEQREAEQALRESTHDLRRAEAEIRASEERYHVLFDRNPFPIWVYDQETLRIVAVNRAAVEHYGYSRAEFLSKTILDIRPPEEVPRLLELLRTNPPAERTVGQSRHVKQDGTLIDVEVTAHAMVIGDRPVALVVARDITERRRVDRLKAEFVSTVSHELRTPLTAVRGALGLLSGGALGELDADAREVVGVAVRHAGRLERLIDDLLDFGRIEGGTLELRPQPVAAASLIRRAVEAMDGIARAHEVALEVGPTPGTVVADADRIQQVLVNLLSNALKFSPRGTTVSLSSVGAPEWVELRVADQGRGVPPELHEAIFERFRQVDSSDSRDKGGAGLGLAICKGLVERHGGTLGVRSQAGSGSTFWFRLPAAR